MASTKTKTVACTKPKSSSKPPQGAPTSARDAKRATKVGGQPDPQPVPRPAPHPTAPSARSGRAAAIPAISAAPAPHPRRKQRQVDAALHAGPTAAARQAIPARQASTPAPTGCADSTTNPVGTAPGKQALVVSLLCRAHGATIAELMEATGWMAHSVRGLLSAVVKRKLGLALASVAEPPRGRVYRIPAPVHLARAETGSPAATAPRRVRVSRLAGGAPANAVG